MNDFSSTDGVSVSVLSSLRTSSPARRIHLRFHRVRVLILLIITNQTASLLAFQQHFPSTFKQSAQHQHFSRIPQSTSLSPLFRTSKLITSNSQSPTTTAITGIKGFRSWFESQFPYAMSSMPKEQAHDTFDHVLIDMNQLLHICLRKSRSEGHALTLLMKELDACCQIATPTKSLVLAMDGPPSASKLATQRKRRLQTIVRTERKLQQMDHLTSQLSKNNTKRKLFSKRKQARKRRRYKAETRTLCITPGTDFMKLTEQAICYWAWQRLQFNNPHHFLHKVKIFISPSTVAGEGEVKLLEWILRQQNLPGVKRKQGESIAILGGDSDLVLEGLVIPPSFTHNVFVLLPDGSRKYLSVSLWETTLAIAQHLPKDFPPADIMRVRTDLVLLLILNGNDYFPKLRGSSGFNKVFHTYLRTLRAWLQDNDKEHHPPYLVNPESLTYNLPFCLALFRHLEQLAPANLLWAQKSVDNAEAEKQQAAESRLTPLAKFHSFVDSGFFPKPVRWKVLDETDDDNDERELSDDENGDDGDRAAEDDSEEDDDDDDEDEGDDEKDGEDDEDSDSNQILVSLKIGKPGTEDFMSYEVWHNRKKPMKKAKHKLAKMALEDLVGDVDTYFDDEDDDNGYSDYMGASDMYSWETKHPAKGKPDAYLGGLLWNLQTYQDGTCSDFSFNYGKRLAPTAAEIVQFLKNAHDNNEVLGMHQLIGYQNSLEQSSPISAGVSCLAALPSEVRELVPEPYCRLDTDTVEKIYGECMDPDDNVFDMKKFERLCDEKVAELGYSIDCSMPRGNSTKKVSSTKLLSEKLNDSHYWVVLSKSTKPLSQPINPPPPFSDRLSELRPNNRIGVHRRKAFWEPRQRLIWDDHKRQARQKKDKKSRTKKTYSGDSEELLNQAEADSFLSRFASIEEISYKDAYQPFQKRKKKKAQKKAGGRGIKMSLTSSVQVISNGKEEPLSDSASEHDKKKKKRKDLDVVDRLASYQITPVPKKHATTKDGQTAVACLKQLQDAGLIGVVDWTTTMPSKSSYASFNPQDHEHVCLTIKKASDPAMNVVNDDVLSYEQDRDVNHVSRQAIRQHLATFAICDIAGPKIRWSELTFKELKSAISSKNIVGSESNKQ